MFFGVGDLFSNFIQSNAKIIALICMVNSMAAGSLPICKCTPKGFYLFTWGVWFQFSNESEYIHKHPTPLKILGYAPLGVGVCMRHISSICFVHAIFSKHHSEHLRFPNMNPDIHEQDLRHPQYNIYNFFLDIYQSTFLS